MGFLPRVDWVRLAGEIGRGDWLSGYVMVGGDGDGA
jgi:hypothetical protein